MHKKNPYLQILVNKNSYLNPPVKVWNLSPIVPPTYQKQTQRADLKFDILGGSTDRVASPASFNRKVTGSRFDIDKKPHDIFPNDRPARTWEISLGSLARYSLAMSVKMRPNLAMSGWLFMEKNSFELLDFKGKHIKFMQKYPEWLMCLNLPGISNRTDRIL